EAVLRRETSQEAADLYLVQEKKRTYGEMLSDLLAFHARTSEAEYIDAEEKEKILKQTADRIRDVRNNILAQTGTWMEKLREMSSNPQGLDGMRAALEHQAEVTAEVYDTMIAQAREAGFDVTALEEEKQRRLAALQYQQLEAQFKAQETAGLTWAQEYDSELARLRNMHAQGLISEEQFQKARLNLQVKNVQRYFDYYQKLASSMVSAIQDAEIAQSEAKYDVLIQQAKNNGEDTAALEEEKENKKLEIQKKYADVDFAVKVSQIIANTAVAIMQAFAQLGPIGGAVAAAMLTATGAAQAASAKAERDKIKNMQPSRTASSSGSAPKNATRVLSGYAEGGYTGTGGRYEVAGVVHRGEYVVPMPIMGDPRVVDAVGTIEAIRRHRLRSTGASSADLPGYADGGHVGSLPAADTADMREAVKELRMAIESLRRIRAYVVLRDIDRAREEDDRAARPFTRQK
ncbi:MAG: phage tail tape measure protein, partial [Duncaniella sp.]|nr:phage tail tape measure protein [Duncaniella sp.]